MTRIFLIGKMGGWSNQCKGPPVGLTVSCDTLRFLRRRARLVGVEEVYPAHRADIAAKAHMLNVSEVITDYRLTCWETALKSCAAETTTAGLSCHTFNRVSDNIRK